MDRAVGPELTEATASDLRLLSPAAVRLWCALVRHRDRAFSHVEWFPASLSDMASHARISYGTAKAALKQLKSSGLCSTSRTSRTRWARSRTTGHMETVVALEENLYLVPGQLATKRGISTMFLPAKQWSAYVAQVRAGIKRSVARVEAWLRGLPEDAWPVEDAPLVRGSPLPSSELDGQPSTSVTYKVTSSVTAASEKAPVGALTLSPDRAVEILAAEDDDLDQERPRFSGIMIAPDGPPLVPLGLRKDAPYLPPDSHPRPQPVVIYVNPDMVPEQKARAVVDGYRWAVRSVYGIDWWHYAKGDIKKARHFDRLLACGVKLAEHSVPAEHWAIWRLQWFKENVRQFASQPPPIWVVMSAKTVSERAGWFRKDYDLPVPVLKPDPIIAEQHLRNREAERLWMGHSAESALLTMPRWYAAKRRQEIADGMDSPHDCWPTKPGSRYGRVR